MIKDEQKKIILESMIGTLELPDAAYEKAKKRYEDLGEWFGREDSILKDNDPHVFPQGSFRLGTAIRPINEDDTYDLDLACKLRKGITKESHTQESVKNIVGQELEFYRVARGIKAPKEEKHRCWRLEYQDELSFHMDIVPCIQADASRRKLIQESLRRVGIGELDSQATSQLAVSITDDRHEGYSHICDNWNISNPEGYYRWFVSRMNHTQLLLSERAQVDDVPVYKKKTPLQRSIQLLKRHRDQMFKGNDEVKPISIIITTLAARAYNGEQDIVSALTNILAEMGKFVNASKPRVPNPVDPGEDFADRWSMPEYNKLNLEQNFRQWLKQAQIDFELITSTLDTEFITEQIAHKYSIRLNSLDLGNRLNLGRATIASVTPKMHSINEPARPWKKEG